MVVKLKFRELEDLLDLDKFTANDSINFTKNTVSIWVNLDQTC